MFSYGRLKITRCSALSPWTLDFMGTHGQLFVGALKPNGVSVRTLPPFRSATCRGLRFCLLSGCVVFGPFGNDVVALGGCGRCSAPVDAKRTGIRGICVFRDTGRKTEGFREATLARWAV